MTFRERLADWISGGAVTMFHNNWRFEADDKLYWIELSAKRREALRQIAAMETPNCASIGKRMAKIAREAME
jgi:hypothetical protein